MAARSPGFASGRRATSRARCSQEAASPGASPAVTGASSPEAIDFRSWQRSLLLHQRVGLG